MTEREASQAAARALAGETLPAALPSDEAALRRWLRERVAEMLRTAPALVMSHLYRVDVREAVVQTALAAPDPAAALADALIAREIEKARYRHHYTPPPDDAAV